jgi:hypothetical protein
MRVDPMMQLNEAITSAVEAIAYPSIAVLVVVLLAVGVVDLRSRVRSAEVNRRRHRNRVSPAAR